MSLVVGEKVTFVTRLLVVNLENVCRETFRASRFVVAEETNKRLRVGVEVAFEPPIVGARPRTVAAHKSLLAFYLHRLSLRRLFMLDGDRRELVGAGYVI